MSGVFAIVISVGTVTPLRTLPAQDADRAITAAIGFGAFDMRGTSTAPVFRIGVERELLKQRAVVEVSVGYAGISEQFAKTKTHLAFYEAQIQAQAALSRFRPYVGVGAGGASIFSNAEGRQRVTGAVSAAVGIRTLLSATRRLKTELRLRRWDFTSGSNAWDEGAAEVTLGLIF